MRCSYLALTVLLLSYGSADATEQSDIEAFNQAWSEYAAAMQEADVELQISTAENTLAAGRRVLDATDERLPLLMINLGVAHLSGKQKDEAEHVLEEALVLTKSIHGENAEELLKVLPYLADARSDHRAAGRQLRLYRKALKIATKHYGRESDEYAALALRAGKNVYSMSGSADARRYLIEAHKYFLATRGGADINTGVAAFYMGKYDFSRRRYETAAEHLVDALAAFENADQNTTHYQLVTRALLVQSYENRGNSEAATEHCIAIGRLSSTRANADYQPIFRMAPRYPVDALRSGRQGHVDFLFTVDENGFVRNAEVLDTSVNARGFKKEALAAVERFRYAPRVENGEAVSVDGIKTRISFELVN